MTAPSFAERFDPDSGLVRVVDEAAARARDRRGQRYVVAWPDRCAAIDRGGGTWVFHSLAHGRQRGYLSYGLARKTHRWRLKYFYVEGARGSGMFVEVPLWEGRARVTVAPFESPSELDPPADDLREIPPAKFGEWDRVLSMPTDPAEWVQIPEGFQVAQ